MKFLYGATWEDIFDPHASDYGTIDSIMGIYRLADKYDAPSVMDATCTWLVEATAERDLSFQVCEHIVRSLYSWSKVSIEGPMEKAVCNILLDRGRELLESEDLRTLAREYPNFAQGITILGHQENPFLFN